MGKVWNISGSFFGASNLIPENATFTKLEVLPESLDTYYNGELFRQDLTYFQATFASDEGEETKITIPSGEVKPKNFDPKVPFSNTLDREYQTQLEFTWTYKPTGGGAEQPRDCAFIVTIWPEKFTVKKVEVIVPPNKTVYYDGEEFDEEGMVVQATSEEGDTKQINYCESVSCTESRDCYYYSKAGLHAGDTEIVDMVFNYCVPADAEHPNGYIAQFTYPITVYQDERKAQLRVTYDSDTTRRLYYSGETLNTSGIKVEKKYPRDDDSAYKDVSTSCKYSILESNNNILNYANSNYGSVTLHIEYYDSITELTSTYDLQNVIYVFEVDRVTPDTSVVSSKTYRAGDTFNKADMPIDIIYKPTYDYLAGVIDNIDSIKINNKTIEQTSINYSIIGNDWINSSGAFLKSTVSKPDGAKTQFGYISPLDARTSKTTYDFEYVFFIERRVYKVEYPSSNYGGTCNENSQGVQALQHLNLFDGSGTQSTPREGIGKIEVQDMTGHTENVQNNLTKYYKSSEGNYQWTVTTYLQEDTDEIHYVWDNYQQSTDPWVSTFTVKVKLTRQLQVTESSITLTYDWNEDRSPYTEVTVSAEGDASVSISASGSSQYCSLQRQSGSSLTPVTYRFTIQSVSGANSTYNATYTFSTSDSSSNEWSTTTYSSVQVRVTLEYINYTPPWAWEASQFNTQSKCNEWWSKFKANCTSSNWSSSISVRVYRTSTSYMSFKATSYKNGYLYFISSNAYSPSSYGASNNKFSSTTSNYSYVNMYSGGATNPQIACKTVVSEAQRYCSGWYNAVDNRTQTYPVYGGGGGSSVTCGGRNSARLWIPSYEEIKNREESTGNAASVNDCSTSGSGAYSATDKDSVGVYLNDVSTSTTIWIRNGSYVDMTDPTLQQMCACTLTGSSVGRWNAKSSQTAQIYFCFRVAI